MFRLTNKLAVSNLIKNRKLYYPFALAVLLAVTITYLFYSLSLNPNIGKIRGGETISMTLALGMVVVTIASGIIVLYANSFVMKNRSKELGVYGMLGLEKRHLISMVFKELLIFGSLTLTAGLGLGALFDKLILCPSSEADENESGARFDFPTNCLHPSSHRLWSYLPRSNFYQCLSHRTHECPSTLS